MFPIVHAIFPKVLLLAEMLHFTIVSYNVLLFYCTADLVWLYKPRELIIQFYSEFRSSAARNCDIGRPRCMPMLQSFLRSICQRRGPRSGVSVLRRAGDDLKNYRTSQTDWQRFGLGTSSYLLRWISPEIQCLTQIERLHYYLLVSHGNTYPGMLWYG